jgi:hypothetical protein
LRGRVVAEYTRREVVTRRVEFALPNPSNAMEYAKACAAAKGELEAAGREIYDNTITITATDAEIIISFDEVDDNDVQRLADRVSELGRNTQAALRRYQTAVEREPSSEAAEATRAAYADLSEIVDRIVMFGAVVRGGGRP